MPYINRSDRKKLDRSIERLYTQLPIKDWEGPLNYAISRIIWTLFEYDKQYKTGNAILGCLDSVAREFYRRKMVPFERSKRKKNGDISEITDSIFFSIF